MVILYLKSSRPKSSVYNDSSAYTQTSESIPHDQRGQSQWHVLISIMPGGAKTCSSKTCVQFVNPIMFVCWSLQL